MTELREYQIDVLNRIDAAVATGTRRIILVAPTGSGKTVMAADLINRNLEAGRRILFMAHRRELISQAAKKLFDVGVDSGIIQAGFPMRVGEPVQVASVQTLWARAMRGSAIELPPANVVIVDEAHRAMARTYRKIIDEFPAAIIIGLTATPCRGDGRGLGSIFEAIIECPSTDELIKGGYLVPTKVYAPSTPNLKGVKIVAGDYVENQLSERVDKPQLVGDIVTHWLKLANGRKTIVFAVDVAHSVHIRDEFLKADVKAAHIDGNTPAEERDQILKDFRDDNLEVVTNCQILTEGYDEPSVSCIVLARPTKHMGLYRQMIGRVLRPYAEKTHALVLDHAGATFQHGFAEDPVAWTLDESKRAESPAHIARSQNKRSGLTTCPACKAIRYAGDPCPACGWRPKPVARAADFIDGDLQHLDRNGRRKPDGPNQIDKDRFYAQLLWIANERGYKAGWAAHKYKEKFQVWPARRADQIQLIEPDAVVRSWVRSRMISWAKSREREARP